MIENSLNGIDLRYKSDQTASLQRKSVISYQAPVDLQLITSGGNLMNILKKFNDFLNKGVDKAKKDLEEIKNAKQLLSDKKEAENMGPQWLKILYDSTELINKTTTPDVFFSRYDLVIEHLKKLVEIEHLVSFTGESPSTALIHAIDLKNSCINSFIERYSLKLQEEIFTLKTTKAKQKRVDDFDTFISHYQHYFVEDNQKTALRELVELESLIEEKGQTSQSLVAQGGNNVKKINVNQLVAKYPIVEKNPGTLNWIITVSFGKTTSKNVPNAVFIAKQGKNFNEELIDSSKIYTVEYTDSREDFKKFCMLYDVVASWKSTAFFINGEMIDKKNMASIKWCYGDKCSSVKTGFCYGASIATENPFGCHRLQISRFNNPWWNYYVKKGQNYVLLKDDLIERINLTNSTYRHCPAFDLERILDIVNSLPLTMTNKEYEKLMATIEKHLGCFY